MKKKLIALTLTALMGFSVLAGCGGNQAAEGGDEAAGESTEPKIVRHNLGQILKLSTQHLTQLLMVQLY